MKAAQTGRGCRIRGEREIRNIKERMRGLILTPSLTLFEVARFMDIPMHDILFCGLKGQQHESPGQRPGLANPFMFKSSERAQQFGELILLRPFRAFLNRLSTRSQGVALGYRVCALQAANRATVLLELVLGRGSILRASGGSARKGPFGRYHRGFEQASQTDHQKIIRLSHLRSQRNRLISQPRIPTQTRFHPQILVTRRKHSDIQIA